MGGGKDSVIVVEESSLKTERELALARVLA